MYRANHESENPQNSAVAGDLLGILCDDHAPEDARRSAVIRLAQIHDDRVVPTLEAVMRSCVPGVWRLATGSLAMQGWSASPGLDRLLVALRNHRWNEIGPTENDALQSLPTSLVEHLIQEDPVGAAKVIEVLGQHGWIPRTPGETAVHHILCGEWDKLVATGESCLDLLVDVALDDSGCFDDRTRAAAAQALENVVAAICADLPERTLRLLMGMPNPLRVDEEVGAEIKTLIYTWGGMRDTIQQELKRRGLWHGN